ncbi:hypothetical protein M436DRAFT_83907 [Aureobasidium namibiae CBS 147.97]|uniref:Uncharacterized protein n=1 Tax=Aureobasidium namibiae CBS 147.97 TaxID=1043004 RepID=A0A074WMD1_9PEZI
MSNVYCTSGDSFAAGKVIKAPTYAAIPGPDEEYDPHKRHEETERKRKGLLELDDPTMFDDPTMAPKKQRKERKDKGKKKGKKEEKEEKVKAERPPLTDAQQKWIDDTLKKSAAERAANLRKNYVRRKPDAWTTS